MERSGTVPGACLIQDLVRDPRYAEDQRKDTKEMYCDFVSQLP